MRYVVAFLLFLMILITPVNAQRFTTCDQCGYCLGKAAPDNWQECAACLYPTAAADPAGATSNKTLEIGPRPTIAAGEAPVEEAPPPHKGRYYTMVGCVSTDLGDFQERTAAGNVVEMLFNVIFSMGGGIALLYLIYGSFLVLTSQADPEKLDHGKRTIYGAIVGMIFIAVSVLLIKTIGVNFLRIPGFSATTTSPGVTPTPPPGGGPTPTSFLAPTLTPIPTAAPGMDVSRPKGYATYESWYICRDIRGWTCDSDKYSQAIQVDLHDLSTGTYLGYVIANQTREAEVGSQCGGNSGRGFIYPLPASLKDGRLHTITISGLNINKNGDRVVGHTQLTTIPADATNVIKVTCAP